MLEGRPIHYFDEFSRYEGADGRTFILYTDIDRLEAHMLELAPQDEDAISEFADALRAFTRMNLPVDITPADPTESLEMGRSMLPVLLPALRWARVKVSDFAARFRDPLLREALPQFFQFSRPDFPMMLMLSSLAMMNDHEGGYPHGEVAAVCRGSRPPLRSAGRADPLQGTCDRDRPGGGPCGRRPAGGRR